MRINDVEFEERDTRYGRQLGLEMPGGHWVTKRTFLYAYASIHANWDSIDWPSKPAAKNMIGIERWGRPDEHGLNQALGRSVRFFVKHNMLPLPMEVAKKRNGRPYKGGSVKYVLGGAMPTVSAPAVKPAATVALTVPVETSG